MASTLCTRMRLLVTVDNYNHTHEHLFEFGVQHAEIAQCQTAGMGGAL